MAEAGITPTILFELKAQRSNLLCILVNHGLFQLKSNFVLGLLKKVASGTGLFSFFG